MRYAVIVAVMGAAFGHALAAAQGEVKSVAGQVVADADGRAVAGVHVTVRPLPAGQPAFALTDANGRFDLSLPAADQYQFTLRKAGFFSTTLNGGDAPDDMRIEEGAVITGRILDDAGEPIVQAQVTAADPGGGELTSGRSDDRGEYRLLVRPTDTFIVAVTTQGAESARAAANGQIRIESPAHVTFYPGTSEMTRAAPMELQPGELRSGLDIVITTEQSVRQPYRGLEAVPAALGIGSGPAPRDANGVIEGRVLDSSGLPLPNALVLLAPERPAAALRMARADEAGGFVFRAVAPGSVRVMASKSGHSADEARPIVAAQQDRPAQIELRLVPWASVTGRVLDEYGEPVQAAQVQMMRTRYVAGRRVLMPAGAVEPETDDRGMYRVYGLEPGTYFVTAQIADANAGDTPGYPRTYYPGTGNPAAAAAFTLVPGQSLTDVDIQLSRTSTHSVTGRILNAAGEPTAIPNVQLWPVQQPGAVTVPAAARVNPDGSFEFADVADGQYVIQAYRGRLNATTEGDFGVLPVTVSGIDVSGLVLSTMAGSTVTGSIVLEAQTPSRQPSRAGIEISPLPADLDLAPAANWATAGVGPDWRFSFFGVSGPRRIVPTQIPEGWALKAVRVNGVEVGDRPLGFGAPTQSVLNVEIVLTDRPSQLRGTVVDPRGQAGATSWVIAFPPEREHWYPQSRYVQRAALQRDGTFAIPGLPPGGYYVVAAPPGADADWQDPLLLESLISRGAFVMVDEGQPTTVQLRAP